MKKRPLKGAGGKLVRSEIIQARLSPKVRFAAEILAKIERRTLSSQIETLLETAATTTSVEIQTNDFNQKKMVNLKEFVDSIWHFDEATRFVVYALSFPNLLSEAESELFRKILNSPFFWIHTKVITIDKKLNVIKETVRPMQTAYGLIRKNLILFWEKLKYKDISELSIGEINTLQIPGEMQENIERYISELDTLSFDFQSMNKTKMKKALNTMSEKINEALELINRNEDVSASLVNALSTETEMNEFVRKFIKG